MSPAAASLDVDALEAVEGEQLGDLRLLDAAVELAAPRPDRRASRGR